MAIKERRDVESEPDIESIEPVAEEFVENEPMAEGVDDDGRRLFSIKDLSCLLGVPDHTVRYSIRRCHLLPVATRGSASLYDSNVLIALNLVGLRKLAPPKLYTVLDIAHFCGVAVERVDYMIQDLYRPVAVTAGNDPQFLFSAQQAEAIRNELFTIEATEERLASERASLAKFKRSGIRQVAKHARWSPAFVKSLNAPPRSSDDAA